MDKVYLVIVGNDKYDEYEDSVVAVFSSTDKARQYILNEYPNCIYDEAFDTYDIEYEYFTVSAHIEEWDVD